MKMNENHLVSNSSIEFIVKAELLAYDFCKILICDLSLLSEKLSIVTSVCFDMALKIMKDRSVHTFSCGKEKLERIYSLW